MQDLNSSRHVHIYVSVWAENIWPKLDFTSLEFNWNIETTILYKMKISNNTRKVLPHLYFHGNYNRNRKYYYIFVHHNSFSPKTIFFHIVTHLYLQHGVINIIMFFQRPLLVYAYFSSINVLIVGWVHFFLNEVYINHDPKYIGIIKRDSLDNEVFWFVFFCFLFFYFFIFLFFFSWIFSSSLVAKEQESWNRCSFLESGN